MIWIVITLVAGLGLLATWLGLRGRRINDHPICRKCRFDLIGVYPVDDASRDARCPECGRTLNAKRAIRFGARQKRPFVLTIGALLLLAAIAIGGAWGWGRASSFNWNTIKPTWWLVIETDSQSAAIAGAALDELAIRAANSELPRGTHDRLVQRALAIQADPIAIWHTGWGDLVDIAIGQEWLTEELTLQYAENLPALTVQVRSPVMHGDSTSLSISFAPYRAGSGDYRTYEIIVAPQIARLNGEAVDLDVNYASYMPGPGRSGWGLGDALPTDAPGENHVELDVQMCLRLRSALTGRGSGIAVGPDPLVLTENDSEPWARTLSATFDVLQPGESDVTMTPAPQHAEAIRDSIRITRAVITRGEDGDAASISVMLDQPPVEVAFEIIAMVGDTEIPIGVCHGRPGAGMGMGGSSSAVSIDMSNATILFRASEDAARQSLSIRDIWDGDIVFDDIEWSIEDTRAEELESP